MATLPTVIVIFGITGDLAHKKLVPALYSQFAENRLPGDIKVIGFARRNWTDDVLRQEVKDAISQNQSLDQATWQRFSAVLSYIESDFSDPAGYQKLAQSIAAVETTSCTNRLFYFATPPSTFPTLLDQLKTANVTHTCSQHGQGVARVIMEKPFGQDLATARRLTHQFLEAFTEDQIYRIDHYLAKETVQNILAFRFANSIFEPLWNKDHIDHIQITAAESEGVGTRGAFYEETGALRDFFQNHLLQLVAAVMMEQPENLSAEAIRHARETILIAIKPIKDIAKDTVRGQYTGYRQENNVDQNSPVETFVAAKVFVDTKRFSGVPFYLRTGKKLAEKVTDITVAFKPSSKPLFQTEGDMPNLLTMRIQPNEGIQLRLSTKKPGFGAMVVPSHMDFCYRDAFGSAGQDPYGRLLVDAIAGDQTLFTSSKEVEAAWHFVTPILEDWQKINQPAIPYESGSWGPKEADNLIEKDGRAWLAQHLIVCPIHENARGS